MCERQGHDADLPVRPPRGLPQMFCEDHPDGRQPAATAPALRHLPGQDPAPQAEHAHQQKLAGMSYPFTGCIQPPSAYPCPKCFVKPIQVAVSQRLLPLSCIICRPRSWVSSMPIRKISWLPTPHYPDEQGFWTHHDSTLYGKSRTLTFRTAVFLDKSNESVIFTSYSCIPGAISFFEFEFLV